MESMGWRLTTDVVAIICVVFAIVYYVLGGGYEAFSKTIENFKVKDDEILEPLITEVETKQRPSKMKIDIETRSF